MSEKDEKAFPITAHNEVYSTGMDLRDWFAGMALQGIAMQAQHPDHAAKKSYEYADAMMKERG